jgi:hypothetical protein
VREFGSPRAAAEGEKLYNHVDLVTLLDIVNLEAGAAVAGALSAWGMGASSLQARSGYIHSHSRCKACLLGFGVLGMLVIGLTGGRTSSGRDAVGCYGLLWGPGVQQGVALLDVLKQEAGAAAAGSESGQQ